MHTYEKAIEILQNGGIGVLPTDTLYGVVGQALQPNVVKRIYKVKDRSAQKPFIILLADASFLSLFKITPNEYERKVINNVWPGPVSVILPCTAKQFSFLHLGKDSLAFRVPDSPHLQNILKSTGPLVAPSANPPAMLPAENINQARSYFADTVDFYVDNGTMSGTASRLIQLEDNQIRVLRP